ncbi:KilA-N domain-containing protein [Sphingobacterium lumbrici]|uniref:KilA-N domain-containing protein n=1 Tax=Sphingobacterium lumbrici TaxID=2559600 RepID=UPI001C11341A|nr:KilA-N domain-containing protein [Sphingobacterium lumbrici]
MRKYEKISIISQKQDDYISLTDMAKSQMQEAIIIKWLTLKSTIEYIGEWEALYNPNFNYKTPILATNGSDYSSTIKTSIYNL